MTLVDRIRTLANQRDMSLPNLESELGLGNGTISRWKNSSPNTDKLSKVADYFDVSVDYLLGRELTAKDEKDIAKDLSNIMGKIRSGEDGPLRYNGAEIDPDSLDLLQDAIEMSLRHLKVKNKEIYDPYKNKR
ncbi:helix-turn-helix domain-containing protein [Robinsoniella sp. KNHs210]|uniref:helix-turn-helix domain-containing protein n=2 Tax=Robinsoniella sp. KNHs210 TaxID=1469950 RepID=UPI0004853073|nr:helix-turn-helix transcriptional regulator [Robinsoniella sp. KNHs210]